MTVLLFVLVFIVSPHQCLDLLTALGCGSSCCMYGNVLNRACAHVWPSVLQLFQPCRSRVVVLKPFLELHRRSTEQKIKYKTVNLKFPIILHHATMWAQPPLWEPKPPHQKPAYTTQINSQVFLTER